MMAFSVAVTEASSRNIFLPLSARASIRYSCARDLDLRAERLQRQQVRVDAAAADGVAARLGHGDAAAARQERTGQQDRGADLLRELDVGRAADLALRLDADDVRFEMLDARAEPFHDLQHDPHVLNVRQVAQHDRLVRQQTRRQDRQRRVLVSAGTDRAFESAATFDDESFSHRGAFYGKNIEHRVRRLQ